MQTRRTPSLARLKKMAVAAGILKHSSIGNTITSDDGEPLSTRIQFENVEEEDDDEFEVKSTGISNRPEKNGSKDSSTGFHDIGKDENEVSEDKLLMLKENSECSSMAKMKMEDKGMPKQTNQLVGNGSNRKRGRENKSHSKRCDSYDLDSTMGLSKLDLYQRLQSEYRNLDRLERLTNRIQKRETISTRKSDYDTESNPASSLLLHGEDFDGFSKSNELTNKEKRKKKSKSFSFHEGADGVSSIEREVLIYDESINTMHMDTDDVNRKCNKYDSNIGHDDEKHNTRIRKKSKYVSTSKRVTEEQKEFLPPPPSVASVKRKMKSSFNKKCKNMGLETKPLIDPIMLGPMGPHRYTFTRPNGVKIVYDIESLVRYFLITGNFCEPETRIFFEDEDLIKIDSYIQQNIQKFDGDLVNLLKEDPTRTTLSPKMKGVKVDENEERSFWCHHKSMLKLRNNHKDYFEDHFFVRDALLGIERLVGDSVNEMMKLVEYTRPDIGHWIFSEFTGGNFGATGTEMIQRAMTNTDYDDDEAEQNSDDSQGSSDAEERGYGLSTAANNTFNQGDTNVNLSTSASGSLRFYDVEEAQMELMTRIFPSFQDLLRQLYEKDLVYGKNVLKDAKLFLKGPPNRPTKDRCSLLPIIFDFMDDAERDLINSCERNTFDPST